MEFYDVVFLLGAVGDLRIKGVQGEMHFSKAHHLISNRDRHCVGSVSGSREPLPLEIHLYCNTK